MKKTNSLVFMGIKNCGKSTFGELFAKKSGAEFFDTDVVFQEQTKKSVREFYNSYGISNFLLEEEKACKKIIQTCNLKNVVISTGGGICDNPMAILTLRPVETFVFLNLPVKKSIDRIVSQIRQLSPGYFENLPSFVKKRNPKSLEEIEKILRDVFETRINQYKSFADICIDLKADSIEKNFTLICDSLL